MGLSSLIQRIATFRVSLWAPQPTERELRRQIAATSAAAALAQDGLEPLPESVATLIGTLRNPNFKTRDAIAALEADPGLASAVLRIANSAAMGGRGECESVGQAFVRLGASAISDLVVAVHIESLGAQTCGYSRLAFQHSVRVARIARELPATASATPERLFLCGLLHDIGTTLLDQSDAFTYYMDFFADDDAQCDAEVQALGFDHALLGGVVADLWGLPPVIGQLVQAHHLPMHQLDELGELGPMAATLMVAEQIEHATQETGELSQDAIAAIASSGPARLLVLSAEAIEYLWAERIRSALAEGGSLRAA